MKQAVVAFFVGVIFAVGLGISGMTQPQKVIGFLDLANWDPSLMFVMVGAIAVHGFLYPLVRRRRTPLLDTKWHVPTRNDITPELLIGSAIFGIGWGLGGFCPGPGVTSLASGDARAFAFVGSMLVGMLVFQRAQSFISQLLHARRA